MNRHYLEPYQPWLILDSSKNIIDNCNIIVDDKMLYMAFRNYYVHISFLLKVL